MVFNTPTKGRKTLIPETQYDHLRVIAPQTYQAVRERGREFPPISRPKGIRKRRDKACFWNALHVAMQRPEYGYTEGFALTADAPAWLHHAWVVDEDGQAIDVTWKTPGLRYVGVTLTLREAATKVFHPDGLMGSAFDGAS